MNSEELNAIVENLAVKVNQLADLQLSVARLVHGGMKELLAASQNLLESVRLQEQRIRRLEGMQ